MKTPISHEISIHEKKSEKTSCTERKKLSIKKEEIKTYKFKFPQLDTYHTQTDTLPS